MSFLTLKNKKKKNVQRRIRLTAYYCMFLSSSAKLYFLKHNPSTCYYNFLDLPNTRAKQLIYFKKKKKKDALRALIFN